MTNVAIVLKTFPPDVIGGMETQTKQMATELHDRDHEVTVFTKRFGSHDDSDLPYEVIRVRNWQLSPVISDLTFLVFAFFSLLRRRNEFDVVQCMMLYPVGFLGYILKKFGGPPYFAWIRGGDYYLMNDVRWKRWMMRRVLVDTLVLAQSDEIKADLENDFDDVDSQIDVLGNGVHLPSESADGDGILYVGRLVPKKGLNYLIEAMDSIEAKLTIVGDGPERDKLEHLATSVDAQITFEGMVPPAGVDTYYRDSSIFVLPSIEGEGMPNAVLEAMAWGLPVIATESGGLPSMIGNDETGYLVPMRDSSALSNRIQYLQSNEGERTRIGTNARQYVQEYHSWESICSELEQHYQRVQRGTTGS